MHRKQWLFVVLLFTAGCGAAKQTADLVLHHGAIYTMNTAAPKAQSMAIVGGRIVAIGGDEEIARQYVARTDIDLQGQMVLPGFHDAHVHPVYGGTELAQCVLNEQTSVDGRNHRDDPRMQQGDPGHGLAARVRMESVAVPASESEQVAARCNFHGATDFSRRRRWTLLVGQLYGAGGGRYRTRNTEPEERHHRA